MFTIHAYAADTSILISKSTDRLVVPPRKDKTKIKKQKKMKLLRNYPSTSMIVPAVIIQPQVQGVSSTGLLVQEQGGRKKWICRKPMLWDFIETDDRI